MQDPPEPFPNRTRAHRLEQRKANRRKAPVATKARLVDPDEAADTGTHAI
jgi:hypothetical protein